MAQTEKDLGSSGTGSDAPGGSTTDQAKEQAQQVTEQAREKASETKEQVASKVRSQIDERSTQAGTLLASNLQDVRSVGEELRKQGKDTPARLADQVAQRGDKIAEYLQSADAAQLIRDVEDFARRNAWAVAAGGFVLGLAASRFVKASSEQRATQDQALPPAYGSPTPAQPPAYAAPKPGNPPAGVA